MQIRIWTPLSSFSTNPFSWKAFRLFKGISFVFKGRARTQSPTNTNYAPEFPTLGGIAGFNSTEVQWKSLDLGELPCWSQCPLCQVSMTEQKLALLEQIIQTATLCQYEQKKNNIFLVSHQHFDVFGHFLGSKWMRPYITLLIYEITAIKKLALTFREHFFNLKAICKSGLFDILKPVPSWSPFLFFDWLCLNMLKRLPMEVVQYHGNLRDQVSKLSLGPSLSKISLIFWTCCAGRIRY